MTQLNRSAERFKEGMEQSLMIILKDERAEMAVAISVVDDEHNVAHIVGGLVKFLRNPQDRATADEKTLDAIENMSQRFKRHAEIYQEAIMANTEKEKQEMERIEKELCSMHMAMSEVAPQFMAEAIEEETEVEEKKKVLQVLDVMDRTEKLIESFNGHSKSYQVAALVLMEKSKQEKEWVEFVVDAILNCLSKVRLQAERFKEGMEQSAMKILKDEQAELDLVRSVEEYKGNITADNEAMEEEKEDGSFVRKKTLQLSKTMDAIDLMNRRFKRHAKIYQKEIMAKTENKEQEMSRIKSALRSLYIVTSEVAQQLMAEEETEGEERKKVLEVLDRTEKKVSKGTRTTTKLQQWL